VLAPCVGVIFAGGRLGGCAVEACKQIELSGDSFALVVFRVVGHGSHKALLGGSPDPGGRLPPTDLGSSAAPVMILGLCGGRKNLIHLGHGIRVTAARAGGGCGHGESRGSRARRERKRGKGRRRLGGKANESPRRGRISRVFFFQGRNVDFCLGG